MWNLPSCSITFPSLVDHRPLLLQNLVSLLEGAILVQGMQSSFPVPTLPASSLTPIAIGSWEHQDGVPGARLETDSSHRCQGQMQDRGCFERSLCVCQILLEEQRCRGLASFWSSWDKEVDREGVCMSVCMRAHMLVCIHVFVRAYVCLCVCYIIVFWCPEQSNSLFKLFPCVNSTEGPSLVTSLCDYKT